MDEDIVWESNDVEFLGVTRDNNLGFDKHVSNICVKANRKLNERLSKSFLWERSHADEHFCCSERFHQYVYLFVFQASEKYY